MKWYSTSVPVADHGDHCCRESIKFTSGGGAFVGAGRPFCVAADWRHYGGACEDHSRFRDELASGREASKQQRHFSLSGPLDSLCMLRCRWEVEADAGLLLLFLLWRAAAVAPARAWRERWMGFPHPPLPPSPPPPFPLSSRFYHTFQVHAMEPLVSWKSSDWWMFLKYKLASNISYRTWGLM